MDLTYERIAEDGRYRATKPHGDRWQLIEGAVLTIDGRAVRTSLDIWRTASTEAEARRWCDELPAAFIPRVLRWREAD